MKTIHGWLCTAALFALPILAGCGSSSSSSTTATNTTSVSETLSDGLTATLAQNQATVAVGGTVTYTASLTNSTSASISYSPVNGAGPALAVPVSLFVENSSSQITYPLGTTPPVVSVGPAVTLAPGQSVSATIAVSTLSSSGSAIAQGYASAGQYAATAIFTLNAAASSSGTSLSGTVGPLVVTAQ